MYKCYWKAIRHNVGAYLYRCDIQVAGVVRIYILECNVQMLLKSDKT
jgi:hypothetical protein